MDYTDQLSKQRLRGRNVVITGATSGVGRGTAEAFALEGANVVIVARGHRRNRASMQSNGRRGTRIFYRYGQRLRSRKFGNQHTENHWTY